MLVWHILQYIGRAPLDRDICTGCRDRQLELRADRHGRAYGNVLLGGSEAGDRSFHVIRILRDVREPECSIRVRSGGSLKITYPIGNGDRGTGYGSAGLVNHGAIDSPGAPGGGLRRSSGGHSCNQPDDQPSKAVPHSFSLNATDSQCGSTAARWTPFSGGRPDFNGERRELDSRRTGSTRAVGSE